MSDMPITDVFAIGHASQIGRSVGLKYVYSGNVPGNEGENTFCARCGSLLIERHGYTVRQMRLQGSACLTCKAPLDGSFEYH